MKEPWVEFYGPDGEFLAGYTIRGTFEGELEATLSLLAYEHGLDVGEITWMEVTK